METTPKVVDTINNFNNHLVVGIDTIVGWEMNF